MAGTITTSSGSFTVDVAGPADGPVVILLHGFPESRHCWRHQVPALGAAGYRAVAPDQRGYSPGARPDPTNLTAYGIGRLVADAVELADTAGPHGHPVPGRRFHVVGHDWGGQVAWAVADRHPDRVASLTVLSRPHPAAFRQAWTDDADGQRHRSRHHRSFHDPATGALLLDDGARRLRRSLADQGVGAAAIDDYVSVLGEPAAIEAALAWYRSAGALTSTEVDTITTPTLYIWGEEDSSVGATAAKGTAAHVTGPYQFVALPGVGHFSTDDAPERITELLLDHLAQHPAGPDDGAAGRGSS